MTALAQLRRASSSGDSASLPAWAQDEIHSLRSQLEQLRSTARASSGSLGAETARMQGEVEALQLRLAESDAMLREAAQMLVAQDSGGLKAEMEKLKAAAALAQQQAAEESAGSLKLLEELAVARRQLAALQAGEGDEKGELHS
eukprot:CAMPEP_0114574466 /NCGR_PEP_ID=MMETSP0114-20121206/19418_1 /TAXON_ID=31324 /ORGANISM="Goniomonas sp, Strain m" /LENGTH=143 /DNA_ID=CAMNT_0001761901 /DNA_START=28 /DNA_END=455 /DNA_ORIENTATION=+